MNKEIFEEYKHSLANVTDNMSLKQALHSDRKGARKFRDYFVFLRTAWNESLSYFAVLQTAIIYTALVPNSIQNINDALSILHIPFQFPIGSTSLVSIIIVCLILLFGVISYRFFGLARRTYEISALYNPSQLLIFKEIQEIKKEIKELRNERYKGN